MKPANHQVELPRVKAGGPVDDASDRPITDDIPSVGDTGWRIWPPSPKMQIAMIALGFGLFNLILLAIWAVVMVYRF